MSNYRIIRRGSHYAVVEDGQILFDVDTYEDAEKEIEELENEYMNCMQDSLDSTGQWW